MESLKSSLNDSLSIIWSALLVVSAELCLFQVVFHIMQHFQHYANIADATRFPDSPEVL